MKRSCRVRWLGAIVITLVVGVGQARAQQAPEPQRQEAAERFDRGLLFFNAGNQAGALAEFQRAYDLSHEPAILYNLALVLEALKRPVEALDAFDKLLSDPGNVPTERVAEARARRALVASQIAYLEVKTSVPAVVELDGVEVGRTPLAGPLRVASGQRAVAVLSPGYLPSRKAVDIAGGQTRVVSFELLPTEESKAHVRVSCPLSEVAIAVDGKSFGQTPLAVTLGLTPGKHQLVFARPGYSSVIRTVEVGAGDTADVLVDLEEDPKSLSTVGGWLALEGPDVPVSEVMVDGRRRTGQAGTLRLAPGGHNVRVVRSGHVPFEAKTFIGTDKISRLLVNLAPTTETLAGRERGRQARKTRALTVTGGGTAILLGAGGFLLLNRRERIAATDNLTAVVADRTRGGRGTCDPEQMIDTTACEATLTEAEDRVDAADLHRRLGWAAFGVGAATAALGTYLLLTLDVAPITPVAVPRPGGALFGLAARF